MVLTPCLPGADYEVKSRQRGTSEELRGLVRFLKDVTRESMISPKGRQENERCYTKAMVETRAGLHDLGGTAADWRT